MYLELCNFIDALQKIDTHEHFMPQQFAINGEVDVFELLLIPYNCDTLISAGCSEQEYSFLLDKSAPLSERYCVFEKYLPLIENTTFFRAIKTAMKDAYSIDDFTLTALVNLEKKLNLEVKAPFYDNYFDRYNIETSISFSGYDIFSAFTEKRLRYVPTVSDIMPRSKADLNRIKEVTGITVTNLDELLLAVDFLFSKYKEVGAVAVKFGSGYHRKLDYKKSDKNKAQKQLSLVCGIVTLGNTTRCNLQKTCVEYSQLLSLDDYLTRYMLTLCEKHQLPAVFHVGMHAWNDNFPSRAFGSELAGLFINYPDVRFVLLHCGAPFTKECILLSRYFKNVYLDFTWLHIISQTVAKETIAMALELVPINKIFAFGGDYCYIQCLAGALNIAKENFACVFESLINRNVLTLEKAKEILSRWYYKNPKEFYKI